MNVNTFQNFSLEYFSFEQVYKENTVRYFAFIIAILSTLLTIPLVYGIIWYEQNNNYRTLINKLAASICFYLIIFLAFLKLFSLSHMIYGATGIFQCILELLVMNISMMQGIFMIISIIVTKYIFVYHLKNPLAIQEYFFAFFINTSTFMLSFLSQFVFVFLPGRNPLAYFVCKGNFPVSQIPMDQPVKINYPVYVLILTSIVIHIVIGIRLKKARSLNQQLFLETAVKTKGIYNTILEKKMLANFKTNIISITVLFCASYLTLYINNLEVHEVSKF